MVEKCYDCGKGFLRKKKIDFDVYGISLGKFEADVCDNCGESFFNEKTSDEIDKVAKAKGLWGLESRTKIGISGDGLIIRLNKRLADFMSLEKGTEVTIIPESREKLSVIF